MMVSVAKAPHVLPGAARLLGDVRFGRGARRHRQRVDVIRELLLQHIVHPTLARDPRQPLERGADDLDAEMCLTPAGVTGMALVRIRLIDDVEALAYAPTLVNRLRRLRQDGQRPEKGSVKR